MITILALALQAQSINLPPGTPIYCLASSGIAQPIQRTDLGRLAASFRREYGFSFRLTMTSDTTGLLTFRGGQRKAEAISYVVKPYQPATGGGALSLQSMSVRLRGVSETLAGDDMCWRTFGIINQ